MKAITTTTTKLEITTQEPLDRNPAMVYLASLGTEQSRRVQRNALSIMANMLTNNPNPFELNWGALRFQHTQAIRTKLAEAYSPKSANRMLGALKGTLKAAWKLGKMTEQQRARACDIPPVRGQTLPSGRSLTRGEITALIEVCAKDNTPKGARDIAIIACMYPGGLRRAEVEALNVEDYNPETGALTVRHGKGNKARITYISNGAGRALNDWIEIRGTYPGALFLAIEKGGRITSHRLTNQSIYEIMEKRGSQAGVANFSPHDFRRTVISDLLDAGADITVVSKLAGHASVDTTAKYDRRPEAAKSHAAGLLHLPYSGKHHR